MEAEIQIRLDQRKQRIENTYETAIPTKDGTKIFVLVRGRPIFDEEGNYDGSLAVITDITERKRAEGALQESEARYRRLVENMNEGLTVMNTQGEFIYVNDKLCEMLGYSQEEIVGKPWPGFYIILH